MTHYLIDTYNLIHSSAGAGGLTSGLTVRSLCQFISASQFRATLVLDGRAKPDEPSENEFPDINLVYSGTGISADSVIADRVERSKSKKKTTVVSNDRAVTQHARRHHAATLSCETFLKLLTQSPRANDPHAHPRGKTTGTSTPGETAHWLKEFGLTPPDASRTIAAKKPTQTSPLNIEDLLGPSDKIH